MMAEQRIALALRNREGRILLETPAINSYDLIYGSFGCKDNPLSVARDLAPEELTSEIEEVLFCGSIEDRNERVEYKIILGKLSVFGGPPDPTLQGYGFFVPSRLPLSALSLVLRSAIPMIEKDKAPSTRSPLYDTRL